MRLPPCLSIVDVVAQERRARSFLEPLGQGSFESWDSGFTGGRSFQIRIPQPKYSLLLD
jgi:hypothetical protein